MNDHLEADIASLLEELSSTQTDLLDVLAEKRDLIASGDNDALLALQPREEQLTSRLQICHGRREELLAVAADEGLPSDSILSLVPHMRDETPVSNACRDYRCAKTCPYFTTRESGKLGTNSAHSAASFSDDRDYCDRRPKSADIWRWGVRYGLPG